jgi:hypothetical protein
MKIFAAFATGPRHTEEADSKSNLIFTRIYLISLPQIEAVAAVNLLGEFSHSNNFTRRVMTVVYHLGLSESYSNLIAKASKPCHD